MDKIENPNISPDTYRDMTEISYVVLNNSF